MRYSMMGLIFTITTLVGLIGMGVILVRKIPVLAKTSVKAGPGVLGKLKERVKSNGTLKGFSGETLLLKILSRVRVLTLKTENKTGSWLGKLRQRSLEKKRKFSDDYWKKLRSKD